MTQLPWHDYAGESAEDLFALSTSGGVRGIRKRSASAACALPKS